MAYAHLKGFRQSPRKIRPVADLIRGRSVEEAMAILSLQPLKAARILGQVLRSAVANAEENESADPDKLVVTEVKVDAGPMLRRFQAQAMGQRSNSETDISFNCGC